MMVAPASVFLADVRPCWLVCAADDWHSCKSRATRRPAGLSNLPRNRRPARRAAGLVNAYFSVGDIPRLTGRLREAGLEVTGTSTHLTLMRLSTSPSPSPPR